MSMLEPINSRKSKSLPDGWRWIRLERLVTDAKSGFACGERDSKGVIQLRMNNVDIRGNFVWNEFIRVPASSQMIVEYMLEPDDVLFNNTNSVELVGKSALFQGHDEPIVYSNHFTRIRTDQNELLPRFLVSWVNYQWNLGVFANICNRWVGQSAVKPDKLLALDFPLPPLAKQKRIASILNEQMAAVEQARKAAEERFEAVQALKMAYLRHGFRQLGQQLPKSWRWQKFGDLAEFKNGINFTADQKGKGILTLDVLNMYSNSICISTDELYRVNMNPSHEYLLKPNDILIVRSSVKREGVGWPALFPGHTEPVIFCGFLIRARLISKQISSQFIAYYLRQEHIRDLVIGKSGTGTITNISQLNLKSIEIPVPPLKKQNRITAILKKQMDRVDHIYNAVTEEQLAVVTLPSTLLRCAFSGEL